MATSLRIIVTGLVGLHPVGGVAWDYLQYVLGLAQLGHDVYYHEDTWSWPYHPLRKRNTSDGNYSASAIDGFFKHYAPELREKWHYLHLHEKSFGMDRMAFNEVAKTADLFLNVSGACLLPEGLSPRCARVFLDTDPGYNQIMLAERLAWSENVERWAASVEAHDQHFTYAENIYSADCLIPDVGYDWKTTRMPIVLNLWQSVATRRPPQQAPWATVMTWNAFKGPLVYQGVEYMSKGAEFEKVIELPQHIDVRLRVAVGGVNAPLDRLTSHGWEVADGPSVTLTPEDYQAYIAESRGELSTAKQVYVAMRSGWFSCRSACYLAAGRPVVVQDTGFSRALPIGEGLLAFITMEEAVTGIKEVNGDYERHAQGARATASEYFDSDMVLTQLLEQAFSGTAKAPS